MQLENTNNNPNRLEITQDNITRLPTGSMCPCNHEKCDQYGDFEIKINANNNSMGGLILCHKDLSKYFKLVVR